MGQDGRPEALVKHAAEFKLASVRRLKPDSPKAYSASALCKISVSTGKAAFMATGDRSSI